MKKCKKENNQITKEKLCPIAKVQRFGDKLNGFINTENCKIVKSKCSKTECCKKYKIKISIFFFVFFCDFF